MTYIVTDRMIYIEKIDMKTSVRYDFDNIGINCDIVTHWNCQELFHPS